MLFAGLGGAWSSGCASNGQSSWSSRPLLSRPACTWSGTWSGAWSGAWSCAWSGASNGRRTWPTTSSVRRFGLAKMRCWSALSLSLLTPTRRRLLE